MCVHVCLHMWYVYKCVCVFVCIYSAWGYVCTCIPAAAQLWRSEDHMQKSGIFYHVGPEIELMSLVLGACAFICRVLMAWILLPLMRKGNLIPAGHDGPYSVWTNTVWILCCGCSKVQFTEVGNEAECVGPCLVNVQSGEVKKACGHVTSRRSMSPNSAKGPWIG